MGSGPSRGSSPSDAAAVATFLLDLVLAETCKLERESEILRDRHLGIERVVLEHHGDVALFRLELVHDATVDRDFARGDRFQAGDHSQQGRFAAARRTHEDDELAVDDVYGHSLND